MRLSIKIVALFFLSILGILALDGYFLVRRDIRLFDQDMRRDALLLGHTFTDLVGDIWEAQGEDSALEFLRRIESDSYQFRIHWVWLDSAIADSPVPPLDNEKLEALSRGEDISFTGKNPGGTPHRCTFVPLRTPGGRLGALQLCEPLTELRAYTRQTIRRSIILGGLIAAIGFFVVWSVGVRMVGRPLRRLVEKTANIGAGDFSGKLEMHGRDELTDLAKAMNLMCEQLARARDAVKAETEAKFEALEQLRHSERLSMLGRISSGLAHELGTPLNVVAGRAKMIATAQPDGEDIAEGTRIICEQVDRMSGIIRQFLDFSRRRSGQRHPEKIEKLAENVLSLLKPMAEKAGVTLEMEKGGDFPTLPVDRFQIEQALMNLVMNGIQAMPQGGLLRVGLNLTRSCPRSDFGGDDRDCLVVKVVDEGIGIPEENIKKVFEPFFTTKKVGQGTGLGMSIVKGIVEEHGGWLTIESEPGQGTMVAILLPLEGKT